MESGTGNATGRSFTRFHVGCRAHLRCKITAMIEKQTARNFPVVCVGGSAGGLDAYPCYLFCHVAMTQNDPDALATHLEVP